MTAAFRGRLENTAAKPRSPGTPWAGRGGSVQNHQVNILEGSTFVVSNANGDIDARPDEPAGFFYRDMRHLSRWQVRMNGLVLRALSGDAIEYDEALFFLVPPTGSVYVNSAVVLIR